MRKALIVITVIFLSIGLIFASNIYGYFRFKSYCSNEGGLHIYEQLEKNVGWWAKDYDAAHVAAQLRHVAFVRYKDVRSGNSYDLRYLGGNPQHENSFEVLPSDESKPITYKWNYNPHIDMLSGSNVTLSKYEVLNFKDDRVLVSFNMFGFSWFNSDKTPLVTNIYASCFNEGGKSFEDLPRSMLEIITTFKN